MKDCHHVKHPGFKTKSERMIRNLLILFSFVGSTSECQNKEFNEDEKGCDHLKKVPICGYVHDTSPVKPSQSN